MTTRTSPIFVKTPQPDTEERLVLVPPDAVSRTEGGDELLTIRTANARDATHDDLARGGYVRDGDTRAGLREALRARERAELDALAELDEQRARAEKAERERDEGHPLGEHDIVGICADARRVLAASGPDPSEVVRAALSWSEATAANGTARTVALQLACVAYRKAGGK